MTQLNDVRRLQRELATNGNGGSKRAVHLNDWDIISYLALIFVPLAHFLQLALWASHLPLPLTQHHSISDLNSTGKKTPIIADT
jgi:hypothetical protein